MTDYSVKTDEEINQAVGMIVSRDGFCVLSFGGSSMIHEYVNGICVGWKIFDPCNNHADAWPIIANNKIGINPATASDKWAAHYCNWDIAVADENPLRAAMIVFLMMQEEKNG